MRRRLEAMRSAQSYPESPKDGPKPDWFWTNKSALSPRGRSWLACISSRITTVIQVDLDHLRNLDWFNEPFAVSPYKGVNLDMHGLIFETSIWLLAGSTRMQPMVSPRIQGRTNKSVRTIRVRSTDEPAKKEEARKPTTQQHWPKGF